MSNVSLESVSEIITKGTTPTTVGGRFTTEGVNFVKSDSVGQFKHLNKVLFQFIDEKTDEKLKRSRLKEGDLLFSIAGAYLGKLSIVRKNDLPANTNQAVGIVRLNQKKADVDYLYYYFSQKNVNEYINNLSSQSSQPNLNLGLLGGLKFINRPIKTQKQIAKVLSDLDAKIEVNNNINQELEAMAKTLYNYWFVQFDFPDANGKPYKSSGGQLVFNEVLKREIPVGWESGTFETIAEIIGGSTPSKAVVENFTKDNQMPWHLPADFAWFKRSTMGKPIVMGRKTYDSIGRPLPGRLNIVVSRDETLKIDGVTMAASVEQALELVGDVEEVMIIGGGSIYAHCLPKADKLYLTYIDLVVEGDTQFPDWGDEFKETYSEAYKADEKNAYNMLFTVLEKQ